jgi:hypothetical protein
MKERLAYGQARGQHRAERHRELLGALKIGVGGNDAPAPTGKNGTSPIAHFPLFPPPERSTQLGRIVKRYLPK